MCPIDIYKVTIAKIVKIINCIFSFLLFFSISNFLNIPKLLEVTKIDGKWAIILEYIEGETDESSLKELYDKYFEEENE